MKILSSTIIRIYGIQLKQFNFQASLEVQHSLKQLCKYGTVINKTRVAVTITIMITQAAMAKTSSAKPSFGTYQATNHSWAA